MELSSILYPIFSKVIKPLVGSGIGNNKLIADTYQRIMSKLLPESSKVIKVQGFSMEVLMNGHVNDIATELMFKGVHEPKTTEIFKKLLKPNDTVVDIGANIGYFTILAAQLVGWKGKVYAFEPSTDNMKALQNNIHLNKLENIASYMMALSDHSGQMALYTSSRESARNSLIKTVEHDGREFVTVAKLDDILCMQQRIKLLKTDTEGNELAVLKGTENTILRNKDINLIVEVNKEALDACGVDIETLWKYLIGKLDMRTIYLINDYANSMELIYSKSIYKQGWQDNVGRNKKCGYNLLCYRNESEL